MEKKVDGVVGQAVYSFRALVILCLFLSILPLAPGQNLHGFIVPVLFYACVRQGRSQGQLFTIIIMIAVIEYGAFALYYDGVNAAEGVKAILKWEKSFFILYFALFIFIFLDKVTLSLNRMAIIFVGGLLTHYWLILGLLSFYGEGNYRDFVLAPLGAEAFINELRASITRTLFGEQREAALGFIAGVFLQLGAINMISSLGYSALLSCLLYRKFVGLRRELFLSFRVPALCIFLFALSWAGVLGAGVTGGILSSVLEKAPILAGTLNDTTNGKEGNEGGARANAAKEGASGVEEGVLATTGGGGGDSLGIQERIFHGFLTILLVCSSLYGLQGLACMVFFVPLLGLLEKIYLWGLVMIVVSFVVILLSFLSWGGLLLGVSLFFSTMGILDQWLNFRGFKA